MYSQIYFPLILYLWGVLISGIFNKKISIIFFCTSGFLWGSIIWFLISLIILLIKIPYDIFSFIYVVIPITIILMYFFIKNRIFYINKKDIIILLTSVIIFILFLIVISSNNFTSASYDSIVQILISNSIGQEGLNESNSSYFASWGIYFPILLSFSVIGKIDYFYTLQPAYAFSILMILFYFSYKISENSKYKYIFSIISCLILLTTQFFLFQAYYIHNNIIASAYLLLYIGCVWLGLHEENMSWLFLGIISLITFSLTRTESPIISIVFLIILISLSKIAYKILSMVITIYSMIIIVWYKTLLVFIGEGSDILEPKKIYIIIFGVIILLLFTITIKNKIVNKFIVPIVHKISLILLIIILLYLLVVNTKNTFISTLAIFANMMISGRWGATWYIVVGLALWSIGQNRFENSRLFSYSITTFFIILIIFSNFRSPYKMQWGDSANRILIHILPIILLYFVGILSKYDINQNNWVKNK